jgi:ketosteroid isomerase-like protein
MKQMMWVCALLFLSAFTLFAQAGSKATGDETKIIALENLWNQIQMKHDGAAMEQLVDADFVLTDYDGTVMNKGQFLASVKDMSYVYTVEVSQDMKLFSHGETVVAIGATHETGTLKGKPFEHHGRFTDTWIKVDGRWVCIASQLSLMRK